MESLARVGRKLEPDQIKATSSQVDGQTILNSGQVENLGFSHDVTQIELHPSIIALKTLLEQIVTDISLPLRGVMIMQMSSSTQRSSTMKMW